MSTSLSPLSREKHPVAETVGGQAIQTIQGLYYALVGAWVALMMQTLQWLTTSRFELSDLWGVRVIALVVAGFGVALFTSGRRKAGPFVGAGTAMCVALVLFVLGGAGVASGALPPLFLIDVGVEFGFVCWWGVAVLIWIGTTFGQSAPASRTS